MESDEFLRKLLRETTMEKAPDDLIPKVLKRIEIPTGPLPKWEPLISKRGWTGIGVGILSLCGMALLPSSFFQELTHTPINGMQWLEVFQWRGFQFPEFSKTTLIGSLAFGIFGLFHIIWMKLHLSRLAK
ncbi:MAG: hypothetical protein WBN56_01910 [Robiginitalea sp.]|uniref:hypothetical protein n=1 Tax=Robiginitalea sp. TaxID=1902411 RepID=UPI003C793F9D